MSHNKLFCDYLIFYKFYYRIDLPFGYIKSIICKRRRIYRMHKSGVVAHHFLFLYLRLGYIFELNAIFVNIGYLNILKAVKHDDIRLISAGNCACIFKSVYSCGVYRCHLKSLCRFKSERYCLFDIASYSALSAYIGKMLVVRTECKS